MGRKSDNQAAEVMKSIGLNPNDPKDRQAYNDALGDLAADGLLIADPDGSTYIVS